MRSFCLFFCTLVFAPFVLSEGNLRRTDEVVELSSTTELESEDAAKAMMSVIRLSFFTDDKCKMPNDNPPFMWIANAKCVPDSSSGKSYQMTASGSSVSATWYKDMSCMKSDGTSMYSAKQCAYTPIGNGSYVNMQAMNIPVGSLPSGPDLGTYYVVFTTAAACSSFSATAANPVGNFVAAQPFSLIGQSAPSPFGVGFNVAQALSCSTDGTKAVLSYWKTNVGKTGALSVASTTPAGTTNVPLSQCYPIGYGPAGYTYRAVCM